MIIKGFVKKGEYFDSVSLMLVAKEINNIKGVIDSAIVMGTKENKAILNISGLYLPEFSESCDTDLLIAFKAEQTDVIDFALNEVKNQFEKIRNKSDNSENFSPKSLDGALKILPDANFSLISIAGKYAASEAMKALKNDMHVMLFSDNVTISEELELKQYAREKGLLVMGPDCGTAIINGVPLAFANVVNKGNIGIIAASGTGLQEVSCIISNEGAGISQAIGTGGRDVKKDIGGIMFIEAFKSLKEDNETKVIVLISKPPHDEVLKKIATEIKICNKPVVTILIGGNTDIIENAGGIVATTLEEAGLIAAYLSKGIDIKIVKNIINNTKSELNRQAQNIAKSAKGKYIRGLFSGGTLCDEAQLIMKNSIGFVYSNTPLNPEYKLESAWNCFENSIVDLGDDEFTVGRPHPMIDFSLRNKKILEEAKNPDVSIILLDVVLGYGSNLNPVSELLPVVEQAKQINQNIIIICSVTGTNKDPQNKEFVKSELEKAGVIVLNSNAAASELSGNIIKLLK